MIRTYLLNRNELENIKYDSAVFSARRNEGIERMEPEKGKQLAAAAELALIYALKTERPDTVLPLDITENEKGKPEIIGFEGFFFNLSHSGDWAVCSISDEPVGVDIEYIKGGALPNPEKILHPYELETFAFITNQLEKQKYFFECWVAKESYLKNLGIGLTVRPTEFYVEEDKMLTEGGHKLKKRYVHIYKSEEIRGTDWKFGTNYRMAVCSMKKDPDSRARIITAKDVNGVLAS